MLGAEKMAELIKGLLDKHEDLSLTPAPMWKAGAVEHPCNSSTGEAEPGIPGVCWSLSVAEFQAQLIK